MKKHSVHKDELLSFALIVLGALMYSSGQLYFIRSLHIPMGGISGMALVANYLWQLPIGAVTIVLNIPLMFLGWRTLGRKFFPKTAFAIVASSLFADALTGVFPSFEGEMLIAALYGGVVMGAGYGLIFRAGGTTGGVDIVAKWMNKMKDIPLGTTSLTINSVIIVCSALIYGNLDGALYAMITSYVSSQITDKMVYGMDVQKNAMIITSRPREVADAIMQELHRGCTGMDATGMYTGDRRTVLLCAVRRHETGTLKRLILQEDENAFMMISNINEVFGRNFKRLEQ